MVAGAAGARALALVAAAPKPAAVPTQARTLVVQAVQALQAKAVTPMHAL